MLFNSYLFVLFFLPVCMAGYYGLNRFGLYRLGQLWLTGMSLWFYAYLKPSFLVIILASVTVNYLIYLCMDRVGQEHARRRKIILTAGILFNLSLLFYYKYLNFFAAIGIIYLGLDLPVFEEQVLMPLGISFFTFQQISFLVDSYRGEVPRYRFLYYISYVTFFPQLVAGPIVTHDELIPQFLDEKRKRFSWEQFSRGIYIFTFGLAKKVLVADAFGNAANVGYMDVSTLDATNAILTMLFYTLQIYFDFSGYGDMAIGIGKLLNIELPQNFNSPYKALTITDFWDRWHMTLTRFFTKYVYIPLGGSRKGNVRTCVNVLIVFLISGLWHGAGFTFLVWGICHGVFSVITRCFKGFFERLNPVLSWLITFTFVNVTWVFFRAASLRDAIALLYHAVSFEFGAINPDVTECFQLKEFLWLDPVAEIFHSFPFLFLQLYLVLAIVLILGSRNTCERMRELRPRAVTAVGMAVLLAWCVLALGGVSPFLYFNF